MIHYGESYTTSPLEDADELKSRTITLVTLTAAADFEEERTAIDDEDA